MDQADQQPTDLGQGVADHARVAGADPFLLPGRAGHGPGQGEHGQGDVGLPGLPAADLVVIQPGLALGIVGSMVFQRMRDVPDYPGPGGGEAEDGL